MSDRVTVMFAAVVGSAVGAVLGYLYFTEEGAQRRVALEPRLRELVIEANRFRATVEEAVVAAREGWDTVAGLVARDMPDGTSRVAETLH